MFEKQFAISLEADSFRNHIEDFDRHREGDLVVYHHNRLPLSTFPLNNGHILVVLGWAFSESAQRITEGDLPRDLDRDNFHANFVRRFSGRYTCLLCDSEDKSVWIYTDTAASLSLFYQRGGVFAASSPELAEKLGFPLISDMEAKESVARSRSEIGYFYPAGLSSYEGFVLLFPNHLWQVGAPVSKRCWPTAKDMSGGEMEVAEFTSCILESLSHVMRCAASLGSLILPITAGRDSRTLLAVVKHCRLERHTLCFTKGPTDSDDSVYGRTLARAHGMEWSSEVDAFEGCCLPGFGGEILKGYWYRELGEGDSWIEQVRNAVPFSKLSAKGDLVFDATDQWLLDAMSIFQPNDLRILDLAYLDLRWAATMGQVNYRLDEKYKNVINVFASPDVVAAAFHSTRVVRDRMSFWSHICAEVDKSLTYLPAGMPHFGRRDTPAAILRPLWAVWKSAQTRRTVFSKAYWLALKKTFNFG